MGIMTSKAHSKINGNEVDNGTTVILLPQLKNYLKRKKKVLRIEVMEPKRFKSLAYPFQNYCTLNDQPLLSSYYFSESAKMLYEYNLAFFTSSSYNQSQKNGFVQHNRPTFPYFGQNGIVVILYLSVDLHSQLAEINSLHMKDCVVCAAKYISSHSDKCYQYKKSLERYYFHCFVYSQYKLS